MYFLKRLSPYPNTALIRIVISKSFGVNALSPHGSYTVCCTAKTKENIKDVWSGGAHFIFISAEIVYERTLASDRKPKISSRRTRLRSTFSFHYIFSIELNLIRNVRFAVSGLMNIYAFGPCEIIAEI